ncbi:Uncharacterized protein SCG7086_BE_00110 [Chlamydiales bacterium SCGC AG-110-P3]|nr:Uncharacterized protein SCG7086_BE_00110 [Chlamydiales bacterium SCGC AG-110-P3]
MEAFQVHPALLIFGWFTWGVLTGYLAQQRGRDPWLWGLGGVLFGLVALIILFVRPSLAKKPAVEIASARCTSSSLASLSVEPGVIHRREVDWFYLDSERKQQGPVTYHCLERLVEAGSEVHLKSYVWTQGMEDWIRWNELSESVKGV